MNKVAIIGGGFAGIAAARVLAKNRCERPSASHSGAGVDVHLFDSSSTFDFLPYLPEVLGRRLSPQSVSNRHADLAKRYGFTYHSKEIARIETERRRIVTENNSPFTYDYLIAAGGAKTNFYGNQEAMRHAFRIRSLSDVLEIIARLEEDAPEHFIVVGGGYTGLESASQLRRYARKTGAAMKIIIVELKETLVPMRAQWMRRYMETQMQELGITVKTQCTVESFEDDGVRLTTGDMIPNALVLWNAGVTVPRLFSEGSVQTDNTGRVVVDEYLRAAERCYVAGDGAHVEKEVSPLPMASYLAIQEGKAAARNVLREIGTRPLKRYKPRTYGLVIPLANGRGCGMLLGVKVKGVIASLIHHLSSYYRSSDRKVRRSIIRDLLREGIGL